MMTFSSQQELFNDPQTPAKQPSSKSKLSKKKPKSQPPSQKKTPIRKETLLSKFLSSINKQATETLLDYQRQNKGVFQRRGCVPQKISLYEDVLLITLFKQNEQKVRKDPKHIKTLCLDLESRTKRKQCTIRERIQKKLCKMTIQQILLHLAKGKDISFNAKKEVTSNSKLQTSDKQSVGTPEKEEIAKQADQQSIQDQSQCMSIPEPKSPEKLEVQEAPKEVSEEENCFIVYFDQDKEVLGSDLMGLESCAKCETGFIVFDRKQLLENWNEAQRLNQERKQKERQIQALKTQLNIIEKVKQDYSDKLSPEVLQLIQQAQKIAKLISVLQHSSTNIEIQEERSQKQQNTTDRQIVPNEQNRKTSEFQIQEQNSAGTGETSKIDEALCKNPQYIRLYHSDPETFEPLLWTAQEDELLEEFLRDFEANQGLFKMLLRYKGPDMLVERCLYLQKELTGSKFLNALIAQRPTNMGRLIKQKRAEGQMIQKSQPEAIQKIKECKEIIIQNEA